MSQNSSSMTSLSKTFVVMLLCLIFITFALLLILYLNGDTSIGTPKTMAKAEWIRVDTNFQNSNCAAFCKSRDKTCAGYGCSPDKWCSARGGMMEIETWNQDEGIVCDRVWEGQCNVPMDRYPPYYNFHCCCQ